MTRAMLPMLSQQRPVTQGLDVGAMRAEREAKRKAELDAAAQSEGQEDEEDDQVYRRYVPSPAKKFKFVAPEPEEEEEEEDEVIIEAKADAEADEKYVEHPLSVPANIWKAMADFQREGCIFIVQNFYAGSHSALGTAAGSLTHAMRHLCLTPPPPRRDPRGSCAYIITLWHNWPFALPLIACFPATQAAAASSPTTWASARAAAAAPRAPQPP